MSDFEKLLHVPLMCILSQWGDSFCIICFLFAQAILESLGDIPVELWVAGGISMELRNPQPSYLHNLEELT